jgi:uncharacterized protein (UPF0333 family)
MALRAAEILILALALLYVIASIYYISNDYLRRQNPASGNMPNLSNLPSNLSGQDLYLVYRLKGYVNMNGSIINIDNAQTNLNARYVEVPTAITNATSNQTTTNSSTEEAYYSVTASGDPLIIWILRNLIMLTYNITDPSFSIGQGWKASKPSDIFGNTSLFEKTGGGEIKGAGSNLTIKYIEYTLKRNGDTIVIWIDEKTGIPILCRINTSWANLELRLTYAS